ncbi:MAG TPA: hypothetical protein VKD69_27000, partial [Vicinamibacterales bacterium]|nr:hypothetical protein [Vicinamibacterales bacterium]
THLATTLAYHPAATRETVEKAHRHVACSPAVTAAADLLEPSLAVLRMLSADGASFARARASYRERLLGTIFGRPELAGRK